MLMLGMVDVPLTGNVVHEPLRIYRCAHIIPPFHGVGVLNQQVNNKCLGGILSHQTEIALNPVCIRSDPLG